MKLGAVNSIDEVWFWLQHGMVPEFWHEESQNIPVNTTLLFGSKALLAAAKGQLDATELPGHFMRWNQIVGGVRLRQRRLHKADCRADKKIAEHFKYGVRQHCHKNKHTFMPFG